MHKNRSKVSAIIAYKDRLPRDRLCSDHELLPDSDIYGIHFYNLLIACVRSVIKAGVDETIVVKYQDEQPIMLPWPNVRVIEYYNTSDFSEWDAKLFGIKHASNDLIITTNADILINENVVNWFREQVCFSPLTLFQGTKGWLNREQTLNFLSNGEIDVCFHEVITKVCEKRGEVFVDGIEPTNWASRRKACEIYLEKIGLDLWKHSGDFQAFSRSLLSKISYPIGSSGWGWGDNELRIRVKEANMMECWNRSSPVWHLWHPVRPWKKRKQDASNNMKLWKRKIDFSAGVNQWVQPSPEPIKSAINKGGRMCCLKKRDRLTY